MRKESGEGRRSREWSFRGKGESEIKERKDWGKRCGKGEKEERELYQREVGDREKRSRERGRETAERIIGGRGRW